MFESATDLLPLVCVIAFFQFVILRAPFENTKNVIIGFLLAAIGLFIFMRGLEIGLFPLGESFGINLTRKGNIFWICAFAFTLGYATTVAEPALIAIAKKAEDVSQGVISDKSLRNIVGLGVAVGITFGIGRIFLGFSIVWSLVIGYLIICVLSPFAPKQIVALAYDCGGVTTSAITVPLVAALGMGVSGSVQGRDQILDGFGLIAYASLFPIIAVLLFSIINKN